MNAKPEMLLLNGLPASGKSTEALAWVALDPEHRRRINWDDLRREIFGADWTFNRKDENYVQALSRTTCAEWLWAGLSVVIDNTNLTERARNKWRTIAKNCGANYFENEIDTPVAECVRRDRERVGVARVGQAVIDRMALTYGFIDWGDPSVYHPSACGKDFVIVDVDGTIADCEHRRGHVIKHCKTVGCQGQGWAKTPGESEGKCGYCGKTYRKDWLTFFKECMSDPPIQPVLDLVHLLSKKYYILIVSGRPMDLCGKATEDWLLKYQVPYHHLFMRDNGDGRDDTIVKHEIAELLPLERVAYVIDDRPKVLRMWQELGLTTLAVGNLTEF